MLSVGPSNGFWKIVNKLRIQNTFGISNQFHHETSFVLFYLLCCPELIPQMAGDPLLPGELNTNESVVQSPMAPPVEKSKI